jgi:K+-sensing histidine kinase KdpD
MNMDREQWRELASKLKRHWTFAYSFALLSSFFASVLRYWFDPVLPSGFPFLTFFPAIIVTAFVAGVGPGIVCAVLSGLVAWYLFIPPANSLALRLR